MSAAPSVVIPDHDRTTRAGLVTGVVFVAAMVLALLVRGNAAFGIALLFLLFVPIEKLFALRRGQKVFRKGLFTDLTHLLVNNLLITVGVIVFVVVSALPFIWMRRIGIAGSLPAAVSIPLAVVLVFFGSYWGHRLTHTVPELWRFHSVHHSIEQMDWVASGRLHPVDSAFTQAFTIMPLFLLGYGGRVFAGVAVFITLIALFQHANVRLRFPYLRWVINTPEWHHWHHSIDDEARDKNFGLPVVDKIFGTAYMPKDKRPVAFGTHAPVPQTGYLQHLAYPFTAAAA
jgi:sterol desaturase/sphingolipid hydroxylase (fatty acid hydroxylase superfamily)